MQIMIAFALTNLSPDPQRLTAWLVQEAMGWFLSLSPALAAFTVWLGLFVVVAISFVIFDAIIRFVLRNVEY